MTKARFIFISILLSFLYLFFDFPGVKITVYLIITVIIWNYLFVRIIKSTFQIQRKSDTFKIFTGFPEKNYLNLVNRSFLPIHSLIITDMGNLDITTVQSMNHLYSARAKKEDVFEYSVIGRRRGKYQIGPTETLFSDLIGLFSFHIAIDTKKEIIVYPNTYEVLNFPYRSLQPSGPIKNTVPIFEAPSIITGMREYSHGDEIKRINWKVSARHGKLYVNNYQPSILTNTVLFLNLYDGDYDFREKVRYQEFAIETAASLFRELFLIRQEFGFVTNCNLDDRDLVFIKKSGKGEYQYSDLLTNLAIIRANSSMPFSEALETAKSGLTWGLNIFVVSPVLDEISIMKLIDMKRKGHIITLIQIHPEIKSDFSLWNVGFRCYFGELKSGIIELLKI